MSRRDDIRERIMSCVEIVDTGYETPCHLWTGQLSGDGRGGGYPRMKLNGQTVAVHRVSFTNEHGYIPGKKQLDHKCRQRRCVRDDHLEIVTCKQNAIRREMANGRRKPRKRRSHKPEVMVLEAAE
ncbi:HNH endonuclease signature motif containing protein [Nitratireductor luteus]|uniref:HNH endonuclease signature motif containing protein n=1 Tax=Nitratireductor luteus TaxID=2976980 RepID=UPI00223F3123|nr:HNH endonuclease signature motif containing protein [Nitratireductor luteus]